MFISFQKFLLQFFFCLAAQQLYHGPSACGTLKKTLTKPCVRPSATLCRAGGGCVQCTLEVQNACEKRSSVNSAVRALSLSEFWRGVIFLACISGSCYAIKPASRENESYRSVRSVRGFGRACRLAAWASGLPAPSSGVSSTHATRHL